MDDVMHHPFGLNRSGLARIYFEQRRDVFGLIFEEHRGWLFVLCGLNSNVSVFFLSMLNILFIEFLNV